MTCDQLIRDGVEAAGLLLIVTGIGLMFIPGALIVAGVFLVLVATFGGTAAETTPVMDQATAPAEEAQREVTR